MEDLDPKIKSQLLNAAQLFTTKQYVQCKKLLAEIKMDHISNHINVLLCEFKQSPQKACAIIKKMMDILVALNIKLCKERPILLASKENIAIEKPPRISHQLYYWNIIVLAGLLGNNQVTQLIANEALYYTDSLRTQTSLMVLYHMLNIMQGFGRLASCISLVEKQNKLLDRVKKLGKEEQSYRFMNLILFNRVLLKLGMIEGSKIMFMMRFNQSGEENKEEIQIRDINGIPTIIYQQILRAEIEYHTKNYSQAIKILSELLTQTDSLGKNREFVKNIIDHNIAIILANYRKAIPAQMLMRLSLTYLTGAKELESHNERSNMINRCKENIIMANLQTPNNSKQSLYESLKTYNNSYSFKMNYRKAQICINFYHQFIQNPSRNVTYKQIHDFYDTVYYYPNQPYFQQKAKNKNPNYTNGKFFYRRYVLQEWEQSFTITENIPAKAQQKEESLLQSLNGAKEVKKQGQNQKKKQKNVITKNSKAKRQQQIAKQELIHPKQQAKPKIADSNRQKLREILDLSECYLKQSLTILEKEKSIIVNFDGEEKGYTQQVNQKLYNEYIEYKSSIYALLCYIYLCKHEWLKTVHYAQQYQAFERIYKLQKNPSQQQNYYNILSYKMEALCELNRISKSYEIMHDIVGSIEYSDSVIISTRSTANQKPGQTYFQKMSQYNNFCFNVSVLHSRDNKIPQAYQSIQKILQQMRLLPSNPQANLPLSLVDLLIHYNLRTSNSSSALQMIKRRRILNMPGVMGAHYPATLNITK